MKNCFKRILIMFVMVLTIMGVGVIQNGIIANAATVGQQLNQPEDDWKRFDDTDSNIKYIGDWSTTGQGNGTFYNNTYHIAWSETNNTVKFNFYGTKIRMVAEKYKSRCNNIKITIDGETEKYSQLSSGGEYLPLTLVYEKLNLTNKVHEVIITGIDAFTVDAIDLDKDGNILPYIESITLNKSSLTLKEGETDKLTATTTPSAVDITWSSSDETIATVDSNDNVKAIKEGQATITAQIKGTDIKADCIVTVTKEDTEPKPTDPEQEYIINTAYAKGDNTNNASGQVSIIFKGVTEAQLKVVKTADVDSVYVGDNFTYTIEVTNTSDKTAKSVVIKDNAPNHIQFIPSEITTSQGAVDSSSTAKNIIVNVGDIPPLGKVIIKIPVLVVE